MREQNIAQTIFSKVIREIEQTPQRIAHIRIALGELSELEQNSIERDWRQLSKGTHAEQARLHIRFIQAEAQCMACFSKYHPIDKKILCPYCGSFGAKILAGEECRLEAIEVDHE